MLRQQLCVLAVCLMPTGIFGGPTCGELVQGLVGRGQIATGAWHLQIQTNGSAQLAVQETGLGILHFPKTTGYWSCLGPDLYFVFLWRNSVQKDCTEVCNESAYNGPNLDTEMNFKKCFARCESEMLALYGKKAFAIPISFRLHRRPEKRNLYCITSLNRHDTAPVPGYSVYQFYEAFDFCFE